MELIQAVGKGAVQPARIVFIEHKGCPEQPDHRVGLVGKGLIFDTGGLNIKPTGFMETMYMDKHGACTVMGAMEAIAALNLPVNVVGVLALAENSVDARSVRP